MEWMRQFSVTNWPPNSPPPPPSSSSSSSCRLLDTYRFLHPDTEGAYTCWSTLLDARKTNYGTRIDYVLSSCSLAGQLSQAEVWQHVKGSDHCPVFAEFGVKLLPSTAESGASSDGKKKLPALCSCWFSGRQSKLSDFMTKGHGAAAGGGGGANSRGTKRPSNVSPPPPAKRTLEQKTLAAFSSSAVKTSGDDKSPPSFASVPKAAVAGGASKGGLSAAWKGVFGGGPKPPLCSGHNEPCALRKVRKQGPNKDRQFWACAKPGGSKGDPQASCNFFKWLKEKKN